MRTDGDTWDIVSSVGLTALGVAAFRAMETSRPDALIHDNCARFFIEAADEPRSLEMLNDPDVFEGQPFYRMIGLRTRFFDDFFTSAAEAGVQQVVIVAAGLDARTYRLDWPSGTTVFEIDQPKVLEFKSEVLATNGIAPRAELRAVAVDLRDDWPAALFAAGFDTDRPTAWSAEGLLPYLPGAAQDSLFERIDAMSAPGSRLSVEGIVGIPDMRRIAEESASQLDKTPFGDLDLSELFYEDDRSDPAQWLADRGWQVGAQTVIDLAARYDCPASEVTEGLTDLTNVAAYLTASK
jgi:methyltransferase (TIGR00027 family)